MKNRKIQLCVFDMDGLMLDSESVYYLCARLCSEKYGYQIPDELILQTMGINERETERRFLEAMGQDFPFRAFLHNEWELQLEYMKEHPIQPKKGLFELLDHLEEKGIRKAVATSTYRIYATDYLKNAGIIDRFDHIVYGDDLTESKPRPQIYLKAIEPFDLPKENILAFEDSENGILSAYNAGLSVIHIPDLAQVKEETRKKCFRILKDLSEAIDVIEEIE